MFKSKIINNILYSTHKNFVFRLVLAFFVGVLSTIVIVDYSFFGDITELLIMKKLAMILSYITGSLIKLLGYKVTICGASIMLSAHNGIFFEFGCLAIRQIIMNLFFILVFYGKISHKISYITVTSIIIEFVNILRAVIIALMNFYSAKSFDLVHTQGTLWLLYGSILTIWLIWIDNNKTRNARMS